jgi:hypothetical protein
MKARHRYSEEMPPLENAYKILTRRDTTKDNATRIEAIIDAAQKGDYGHAFPQWSARIFRLSYAIAYCDLLQ